MDARTIPPELPLIDLPRRSNPERSNSEDQGFYQSSHDYLLNERSPRRPSLVDMRLYALRLQYRG